MLMPPSPGLNRRSLLAFIHDVAAVAIAWMLAFLMRENLTLPFAPVAANALLHSIWWVVPLHAVIFWWRGLYQGIWRYASLSDLKRIIMAVGIALVLAALAIFMTQPESPVPRMVLVLHPILLIFIMAGSRFGYRTWREHRLYGPIDLQKEPVILLGAGDAAAGLVAELSRSKEWRVIGLLDDNPDKHGRLVHGVKVLGKLSDLPRFANEFSLRHAIIAMPSVSHEVRRKAVRTCADAGLHVLTVPAFDDLMTGKITLSQIREVELDDLLGRDPVELDNAGLRDFLAGRVVMVTGAGGSIGSELCRQIAAYHPARLVFFEASEFALYAIEQEFGERYSDIPCTPLIGDVKDLERVNQVLAQHRPTVIFHAAAYKHVPLMEGSNAWAAIRNNAWGTYVLAKAAKDHGVREFVLISTDKAVNPVNIMGASKRLAEQLCQALQKDSETRFVIVRFGNVLGSAGSVIPKFRKQLAQGGPITVTHPEVSRYFMSIREAAQLVLQAGLMGRGAEIFVLDMGDPVRIVDLVRDMIRLTGFAEGDIRVEYTGLRPGEKMHEQLLADREQTCATAHPKLRRVTTVRAPDGPWLDGLLTWLREACRQQEGGIVSELKIWVPEFSPAIHSMNDQMGRESIEGHD